MKATTIKEYAHFLLQGDHLNDLSTQTFDLAKTNNLPLLKLLSSLTEDELILIFRNNLHEFLIDIIQNRAIDHIIEAFTNWQKSHPDISFKKISPADIVIGYTIRKQVLVNKIALFTLCPVKYIEIVQELDALLLIAQKIGLEKLNEQSREMKK